MRRPRLLIYILLLILPLQGLSAVVQFKQPCPMEQAMERMNSHEISHEGMSAPGKHDCCEDDHGAAHSGQPCKPGQECHVAQPSISHTPALLTSNPNRPVSISLADSGYAPLALTAIWRPPLFTSL